MAEEINIHVATDLNTEKLPIKTVNNISPDSNGNIAITSVNSATNATKAVNSDYATSSIKATQDSAGQQINKTYIKELSVSGRTITYKRGDNTTGTITTQDTNTTYSKLSQFTNDSGYITSSGSCASATNATQASYSNQLQAFTGDDFTGGNHFVKAIRSTSGWSTRLWMCYNGGAKQSNEISVAYADSAGSATNATNATKATQDSAGQQINKTYIKELSVSGRTITYKRGDNTTGTITTQDTNTTYGVATTSSNGLMSASDKVKLNTLPIGYTIAYYAPNGTMSASAVSLALGATTSGSNLYDYAPDGSATATCGRNETYTGTWQLITSLDNTNGLTSKTVNSNGWKVQANKGLFKRIA